MSKLRDTLYNVLLSNERLCCFCFNTVTEEAMQLHDEVALKTKDTSTHLELREILEVVLGNDVSYDLFSSVCDHCTVSAIDSYTFINNCKENSRNLYLAISSLQDCIQNASNETNFCNSLFLSMDVDKSTAMVYYDYKRPVNLPTSVLRRFKVITSGKNVNSSIASNGLLLDKIKDEQDSDNGFEMPVVVRLQKQKSTRNKFKYKNAKAKKRCSVRLPLKQILHEDSNSDVLKCKQCQKSYPNLGNLQHHFLRMHAPKIFKCTDCPRSYGSLSLLHSHIQLSHRPSVCMECGKTYNNKYSLRRHEQGHRLRLVCQDCGRVYKNSNTFKQHTEFGICRQVERKSVHKGTYECDICGKKYSRKNTLRGHINFEHNDIGATHVCTWCNKKFSCQSRLKSHIVTHTQEKKFPCEICGGKFVTRESLLYHTRIHTGEKPYACSLCDLRFLSSSRRAEHIRRHHLAPSLECDVCHSKFKARAALNKHKRRHFNPKSRLYLDKMSEKEEEQFITESR